MVLNGLGDGTQSLVCHLGRSFTPSTLIKHIIHNGNECVDERVYDARPRTGIASEVNSSTLRLVFSG